MKLVINNGRVIDPSQDIDAVMDVVVTDGVITALGTDPKDDNPPDEAIDATGMVVTPGLIDMHTHLREPGFEYKETILSGSAAAVAGGFTSIACMANTDPVNDTRSVTEFIIQKARAAGKAHVYPVAAVTRGLEGSILAEFGDLKDAGAVAFSDDGNPVIDSGIMRRAVEYAASLDTCVISHCEDRGLSSEGLMNESLVSTRLGVQGIPSIAEDIMVARDIALAEYTGAPIHIAHVSTAGAVALIDAAKSRGVKVTAETAPHYFTLSDIAVEHFSTNTKMYPPLRSNGDVNAVKKGLKTGVIDVIASDHAPHSSIEKDVEFEYAANGIIGLETSLALSLSLVAEGFLSLMQLVALMSTNPARILRLPKGTLSTGADADITIIDTEVFWTINPDDFISKSRNCPFTGMMVTGKAVATIVNGQIVFRAF